MHAFLAAVLSGVLLTLSFPPFGHPSVAWVALVPLMVVLHGTRSRARAFGLALTAGVLHFGGTLPWLTDVMVEYGGLARPLGIVINGLLVAYLALFPAVFGLILVAFRGILGSWMLLAAAPIWLSTELGRVWLLGGFPWELLGYSQTAVLPVAQIASLFGVHGVTLLVVFINGVLAFALVQGGRRRTSVLTAGALVLAVVLGFGGLRLSASRLVESGEPLRVGLIQGNVAQEEKWDRGRRQAILSRYLELTRESASHGAKFVVWPESATPFAFEDHPDGALVRQVARETGIHLLFGSTRFHRGETPPRLYNAAYALGPQGDTVGVYHKMHLVPFGEYVPLRSLLFFASPLVEAVTHFSPGTEATPLAIGTHLMSAAICYEIIYPALSRAFVRQGSELLTTITNDAWYGRSGAPHQHFQQARMRAIEQGRYLVRAANTGISGVVDPYGRVLARTALFEPAAVTMDVRLLTDLTWYARIGDLPAYLCLTLTVVGLWLTRRRAN